MAEAAGAEEPLLFVYVLNAKNHQDRSEKIDYMNNINLCLTICFHCFLFGKKQKW